MGINVRIEGKLKNENPQILEDLELLYEADRLFEKVLKDLEIPGKKLWVVEEFKLTFLENTFEIFGDGKFQFMGIETFLIFLSRQGFYGKILTFYEGGTETFKLEKGKVISSKTGDVILEELMRDEYFLWN
ncbi:MAG: hypothetical protein V1770_04410 [bacterium]